MATADETLLDRLLKRLTNRPLVAWTIIGYLVLSGIAQGFELGQKIWQAVRSTPDTSSVFVDCRMGVMPSIMPESGRVEYLLTNEVPQEMGGGGFVQQWGKPGAELKFTSDGMPAWAYGCDAISNVVLMNVSLSIRTVFHEPEAVPGQPKSRRHGRITLDRHWEVTIPRLDAGVSYRFYIWNCCVQRFVQITLPNDIHVEEGNKTVRLIQAKNHLFQSLYPVPWPEPVKP